MAKHRIPTQPNEVRDVLTQIATAINEEPNWPTTGLSRAEVIAGETELQEANQEEQECRARHAQARARRRAAQNDGIDLIKRADYATDGLYGPRSPKKEKFGLPPRKYTRGESHPLKQVVITHVQDGTGPASIALEWKPIPGAAAYQVEWFLDIPDGAPIGNAAASESAFEITALQSGQQYWIHVRAIRGKAYGSWSDPATRVANL